MLLCCLTIGSKGEVRSSEESQMNNFTVCCNPGSPCVAFYMKINTLEFRSAVFIYASILLILRASGNAQVIAAIIKTIAIFMINFLRRQQFSIKHTLDNDTVHPDAL